jgi:hypothetical protein
MEKIMNNTLTAKFAALGVALLMNSFLLGGVAYLFNNEAQANTPVISVVQLAATTQTLAV